MAAAGLFRSHFLACSALVFLLSSAARAQIGTSIEIEQDLPDPSLVGQGIVVSALLVTDDDGAPTGTITFDDGADGCVATLPETWCLYQPQSGGTKSITATYSGDVAYGASDSSPVTHEVAEPGPNRRVSLPNFWTLYGPVLTPSSASAPSLGQDGQVVAYIDSSVVASLLDRRSGTVRTISQFADGDFARGLTPVVTPDGRFVAFSSRETNLVSGVSGTQVYLRDTTTGTITLISKSDAGVPGDASRASSDPSISDDGRFVAFQSSADNLVGGDTNNALDCFVHDMQSSTTTRVSLATDGTEGDNGSVFCAISGDGLFVAFQSQATNFVTIDANGFDSDVFVHDTQTGTTKLVSIASDGTQGNDDSSDPKLSVDGRYVVFQSRASNLVPNDTNSSGAVSADDIFMHDTQDGTTMRVSVASNGEEGNGNSRSPAISADGRYVAFNSAATNFVATDANGTNFDVFVRDTQEGETVLVNQSTGGAQGTEGIATLNDSLALSPDGRHVAFVSRSGNLVADDPGFFNKIFLRDLDATTTSLVGVRALGTQADGFSFASASSGDGRYVAFESQATNLVADDDVNGSGRDIFRRDLETGAVELISEASGGGTGNSGSEQLSISNDGRIVAFRSFASDLVTGDFNNRQDVFVWDGSTESVLRASVNRFGGSADGSSFEPDLSGDGRYVVFSSFATNLVSNDTNGREDVFRHEIGTGTTIRVNLAADGSEVSGNAETPSISNDGRLVAFTDSANGLTGDDIGFQTHVFIKDLDSGVVSIASRATDGTLSDRLSKTPELAGEGRFVAFVSRSTNLVPTSSSADKVFVRDLETGTTTLESRASDGTVGNNTVEQPMLSDDGRYLVFQSRATNLAPGKSTFFFDVFLRYRTTGETVMVSAGDDGDAEDPSISADGRFITFRTPASDLVVGDSNNQDDVFRVPNPLFNALPEATADAYATSEESPLSVPAGSGVLANDSDPEASTLSVVSVNGEAADVGQAVVLPSGATVTLRADGSFDYEPAGAFDALGAGGEAVDAFEYGVSDGTETAQGTASITVAGENDAPVAANDAYVADENGSLDISAASGLLANDSDVDQGDTLSVADTAVAVSGIGGSLSLNADGSFQYVPPADTVGQASFGYEVTDGTGVSAATVVIDVVNVDSPPQLQDDVLGDIAEDSPSQTIGASEVLANDSPGANDTADTLTIVGVDQAQGGTAALNGGDIVFTPAADYFGSAGFRYRAQDSGGTEAMALASFEITPVNDPPTFTLAADLFYPDGGLGTQVVPSYATGIGPGPGESGQTLTGFTVTEMSDPNDAVRNAALGLDGTLSFDLGGAAGTAMFEVTLTDELGLSSAPSTFEIEANAAETDLAISITDDRESMVPGDTASYAILVLNNGQLAASGARVQVPLPPEILGADWTCVPTPGASCASTGVDAIDERVDLPAGGDVVFFLDARTDPAADVDVEVGAEILEPAELTDPDPVNNTDSDTTLFDTVFADDFEGAGQGNL